MNHPFLMIATMCVVLIACNEKNEPKHSQTDTADRKKDTISDQPQPYFPVHSFVQSEIAYVDSLPVGLMKYTTRGTKTDSQYIDLKQFHRLADEFVSPELKDSTFTRHFRETSFFDRSTNNATFFYTTTNDSVPLKRVDVVTAKGDVYDEVKSLYMEKNYTRGDTTIVMK